MRKEDYPFQIIIHRVLDTIPAGEVGHDGRWEYTTALAEASSKKPRINEQEAHKVAIHRMLRERPDLAARAQLLRNPANILRNTVHESIASTVHLVITDSIKKVRSKIEKRIFGEWWA